MKALKKFHNYLYKVRFLVETDIITFVHQLYLPANDMPGVPVIRGIAWMCVFDFELQYLPGRLKGGSDCVALRPRRDKELERKEQIKIE
jgi:hypothetical protein